MNIRHCLKAIETTDMIAVRGRVSQVIGMVVESHGPGIPVGSICEISTFRGQNKVQAEVVGFREGRVLLMPLGEMRGVEPGSIIQQIGGQASVPVSESMLGRIIDGLGNPVDGKGPLVADAVYPLYAEPLNPMERMRI